jgi:hypothetical protein
MKTIKFVCLSLVILNLQCSVFAVEQEKKAERKKECVASWLKDNGVVLGVAATTGVLSGVISTVLSNKITSKEDKVLKEFKELKKQIKGMKFEDLENKIKELGEQIKAKKINLEDIEGLLDVFEDYNNNNKAITADLGNDVDNLYYRVFALENAMRPEEFVDGFESSTE